MPCFQGLAVSIHTPDGPLPEYSIQKQSRIHRIASYIPVPPAQVKSNSTTSKPTQSTFAISITLLTPGLNVPYSTPKATPEDPYPRPKIVGGLPGYGGERERGKYGPVIGPYVPITASQNETIAAYIYFDGRPKEEVATLLRRGEETWVNSRWVSVPQAEGGGLAEREFLFREVGLERWLNGLDLEGKDVGARVERRRQRLEKKRRKKKEQEGSDMEEDEGAGRVRSARDRNGVLRYGDDKNAPLESLSGDEGLFTSDSDSDDEPPTPEAAGQIKVALFRVLASGEIKRGEYSPQFDAHDDDDGAGQNGDSGDGDADVDHTTSFAKPKTLDPKSISTQTVTGIDPPDKPYAVFTFLYRGEKQLRKMGILPSPNQEQKAPSTTKRKSTTQIDFSSLKPLDLGSGIKNYSKYRERESSPSRRKSKGKEGADAMDSDADDDDEPVKTKDEDEDVDPKAAKPALLSPEDAARQGELAEGVRKIKRQSVSNGSTAAASPTGAPLLDWNSNGSFLAGPVKSAASLPSDVPTEGLFGSPFKKQRASDAIDETAKQSLNSQLMAELGGIAGSSSSAPPEQTSTGSLLRDFPSVAKDEDEEL
ncbi:hypothetical protein K402DRAFT_420725 [Aulographum hederae CBS 113979]|uniref:DUF7918 domain-containing protein n=1 Tax=Aulographum hederae CBS 113979 TaxID=1176131 RepID=A0A6G1H2A4_9PEZI|nr:hypothetical protein K402DRAFT_420725 [Aulographum hederae CBS 113979]